jgi:hypothetical protein
MAAAFMFITNLIQDACNKMSVRMTFLFVFPQLPFLDYHRPALITSHLSGRRNTALLKIVFMVSFFLVDPAEVVMEESMDTILYLRGS